MNKLTSQLSDTRVYTASIDGTVAVRDFEGRDSKGIWIHFNSNLCYIPWKGLCHEMDFFERSKLFNQYFQCMNWWFSRSSKAFHLLVFTWGDESSPPCRRVADTSRLRCGRPSPLCCSVRCLRGFPPLLWIYVVVSVIPLLLLSVRCSIFFFATFLTSVHGCRYPLALHFALLQFSLECLLGGGRLHSVWQAIPRIYHSHSERIFPGVRSCILHCQAMGCGGLSRPHSVLSGKINNCSYKMAAH